MIISYAVTDVGKIRPVNQDYVFSCLEPVGNLPNLFLVADGMGGHRAGDFASSYSVRKFLESASLSLQKNPYKIFEDAIRYANKELIEKAKSNPELKGMGTTMVAMTIKGEKACVANVGDSRLYCKQNHTLKQITIDHSLVQEMVRLGELTQEGARMHPDKNIITRAVGAGKDIQADYFEIPLTKDSMLLMCSDGLSNMVEDSQINELLRYDQPIDKTAISLVDKANENGGKDNIAVIVIKPEADEV
ncbi:MAG: Stp1/IreP family PP2C-type Ser/Thr phosphatase [Lachnospiraceae bacterium]